MIAELTDVESYYGESRALHGVSLGVEPGVCTVLLGRNGAGKTTTLKTIAGEIIPKRGCVLFDGADVTRTSVHKRARRGLSYVPSDAGIFARLTVAQNLTLAARGGENRGEWTRDRVFSLLPALPRLEHRAAGVLSGGERQQLKLAMALLTEPKLILLDEPTQGVAPVVVGEIRIWLADLLREGMSILLSEQNAAFAAKLGSRAYVIEKGVIVASGSMADMSEPEIVNKYLAV